MPVFPFDTSRRRSKQLLRSPGAAAAAPRPRSAFLSPVMMKRTRHPSLVFRIVWINPDNVSSVYISTVHRSLWLPRDGLSLCQAKPRRHQFLSYRRTQTPVVQALVSKNLTIIMLMYVLGKDIGYCYIRMTAFRSLFT